ncbi:MAG: protein-tyrosine phosphatase [Gammaproteobacteria bacterium]|jgi:protein-tyrosine phosphatase
MGQRIALEGATNFRDLGGYVGFDGRVIRDGLVYRSDALHRLTDTDHATISKLNVRYVCDLRYGPERAREPSRLPAGVDVLHVGLADRPDASFADSLELEQRNEDRALEYLTANYRQYPHLYHQAYRTVLNRLLEGNGAVVFHCTAGKDRAGLTAVMVLMALGVPYVTVLEDYLKTNQYWDRGDRTPADWPKAVADAIFTAREPYLKAALASIDSDFGGFDRYLHEVVGFSPAQRTALIERMLA